jgi:predicted DCC family thiol-disulfide oxidoreductase YuxK
MARESMWVAAPPRGWVLYDGDCDFCTRWAWRLAHFVGPRGYHLAPLQAHWVRQRLALTEREVLGEMRVLTSDDVLYGGADALVFLGRQIPWARPFAVLARLPGVMPVLRGVYRWVARHRHCATACASKSQAAPPASRRAPIARHPSGAH